MSIEQDKLIAFENAVLGETNREIQEIENELRSIEDAEMKKAQDAEYNELFVYMQQQVQDIKASYKKQITKARLTAKQDLLKYRNQMVDELFTMASDKILLFANSPAYPDYVLEKLQAALEEMPGDELTISVRAEDVSLFQAKLPAYTRITTVCEDPQNLLGGFSLINSQAGLLLNCRLQTALEDKKPQFHASCGLSVQF